MITLINGRGQLGTTLKSIIEKETLDFPEVVIYHTWNIIDKSEEVQKQCYEKFVEFVKKSDKTKKIIFISTYSQQENYYNHYKQLAEAYLIATHEKGYVIRLPTLIGKGICEKFRDNQAEAFGEMELMIIKDAAREVLKIARNDSLIKTFRINGEHIPASLVKDLILFGRENSS